MVLLYGQRRRHDAKHNSGAGTHLRLRPRGNLKHPNKQMDEPGKMAFEPNETFPMERNYGFPLSSGNGPYNLLCAGRGRHLDPGRNPIAGARVENPAVVDAPDLRRDETRRDMGNRNTQRG